MSSVTAPATAPAPAPPVPAAPKSGFLASEFWVHLAAGAGAVAAMALTHSPDPVIALGFQAAAAVYTLARTWLKTKHVDVAQATDAVQKALAAAQAVKDAASKS